MNGAPPRRRGLLVPWMPEPQGRAIGRQPGSARPRPRRPSRGSHSRGGRASGRPRLTNRSSRRAGRRARCRSALGLHTLLPRLPDRSRIPGNPRRGLDPERAHPRSRAQPSGGRRHAEPLTGQVSFAVRGNASSGTLKRATAKRRHRTPPPDSRHPGVGSSPTPRAPCRPESACPGSRNPGGRLFYPSSC